MAPRLPRTSARNSFNSSELVRLLADLAGADAEDSRQSLVERLGSWLGWADAISLASVLDGAAGRPPAEPGSTAGNAVLHELARARAELGQAITTDRGFATAPAVAAALPAAAAAALDGGSDFAPYRRRYTAHQRAFETRLASLRAELRAALVAASAGAGPSSGLRRLAALDAVLEEALAVRERSLLARVPGLLEKRFQRLRAAQRGAQAPAGPVWPHLGADLQAVLRAELDVRLQPLKGLADALVAQDRAAAST